MTEKLRKLLETIITGNNDLMKETIDAAKKILAGGYEGHQEDVEALEGIETGFELERVLSQGKWYWQKEEVQNIDYCPGCNIAYCRGRYTTGQCE